MVLHRPHAEGGFGVTFNDVTKDADVYTTTSHFVSWVGSVSQERQDLWLTKDDLQDPSSWSSSPFLLLRDIHSKVLAEYDCKEGCVPSQSQEDVGVSGRLSSKDGDAQHQDTDPLLLPQVNTLHENSIVRGEDSSDSEVALILALMDTYITIMILIGHLMRLSLTKLENIVMIIITIPLTRSSLCLLLLTRLGGYTVNLCVFYFYKIIGKLTVFFQRQEFSLRN